MPGDGDVWVCLETVGQRAGRKRGVIEREVASRAGLHSFSLFFSGENRDVEYCSFAVCESNTVILVG